MHPADRGVVGVGDDRHVELELGLGEIVRIAQRGKVRHRVIGRIETVLVDMAEIGDHGLAALVHFAVGDPQRRVIAAGIERVDDGAVFLVADDAVVLAAGEIAQLIDDRGIGRAQGGGSRRRRGGRRRRRAGRRCGFRSRGRRSGCRRGRGRLRRSGRCRSLSRRYRSCRRRQVRRIERLRRRCRRGGLVGVGRCRRRRIRGVGRGSRGVGGCVGRSRQRDGGSAGQQQGDGGRGEKVVDADARHCKFSLRACAMDAASRRLMIKVPIEALIWNQTRGGRTLGEPARLVLCAA